MSSATDFKNPIPLPIIPLTSLCANTETRSAEGRGMTGRGMEIGSGKNNFTEHERKNHRID
jgi:hypothetical protein